MTNAKTGGRATFWDTAELCRKIVATWPEWKQNIVISAEAARTGKFLRNPEESKDERLESGS